MNAERDGGRNDLSRIVRLATAGLFAFLMGAAAPSAFAVMATGGNTTKEIGGYRIHTFTNSATASNLVVTSGGNVDVLVVAGGGGGGGRQWESGGGGGGGVVYVASYSVTAGTYSVTVGTGGAGGGYRQRGSNGSNSTFGALTAYGGGGGGNYFGGVGRDGGCGGGGAAEANKTGGTGSQGGNGGTGQVPSPWRGGGGGGAAPANGEDGDVGGNGGAGYASSISGSSVKYAGGGGGGSYQGTPGKGTDGGGDGAVTGNAGSGTNGIGGGGGGLGSDPGNAGAGGSGTVIVRYELSTGIPPTVDNAGGATNVTPSSADLNGTLISTGSFDTAVIAYWGSSDGGTNASAWAHTNTWDAPRSPGGFTASVTDLSSNTTYYYRFAATNQAGPGWAATSTNFITGNVWVEKLSDASEIGPTPGVFTVHRVAAATNEALGVNYAVGGTASNGVDYATLNGCVTIPAGTDAVALVVSPYLDPFVEGTETVQVTVVSGPYAIGASSNAPMAIADAGAVGLVWGGGGANNLASTPANWMGGVAPQAGDSIVLTAWTNKNITWDLNIPLSSWTQVGYVGTVTVASVYGATGFTSLNITGNCVISNGVWTQIANPAVNYESNRLCATIGGNLAVGPGASINVTAKGYTAGKGPGGADGSIAQGGGSYGGRGATLNPTPSGPCYGSIVAPTNLGSGGEGYAGGGAILLTVSGGIRNDGLLCADGAGPYAYLTGSGGSIYLIAGALTGVGTIQANGGPITANRAGGGGRVSLTVTNAAADFSSFTGTISACGAGAGAGAGTIYKQVAADRAGRGTVLVANNGNTGNTDVPPATNYVSGEVDFVPFSVTNGATLRLTNDFTVGDIFVRSANAWLDLGSKTLTVRTRQHAVGPGTATNVLNYGAILWVGEGKGTLVTIR